jgi:hypothetical protein
MTPFLSSVHHTLPSVLLLFSSRILPPLFRRGTTLRCEVTLRFTNSAMKKRPFMRYQNTPSLPCFVLPSPLGSFLYPSVILPFLFPKGPFITECPSLPFLCPSVTLGFRPLSFLSCVEGSPYNGLPFPTVFLSFLHTLGSLPSSVRPCSEGSFHTGMPFPTVFLSFLRPLGFLPSSVRPCSEGSLHAGMPFPTVFFVLFLYHRVPSFVLPPLFRRVTS